MKVVCDNCRAVYKVSDDKLVKAVNKATCRNCHYRMLIPRPNPGADPNERILVSAVPPAENSSPGRREPSVPVRRPGASVPISRSRSLPPGPAPSLPPRPAASIPPRPAPSLPPRAPGLRSRATPPPARPRGPVSPAPRAREPVASGSIRPGPSGPPRSVPPGPSIAPSFPPSPSTAPTSFGSGSFTNSELETGTFQAPDVPPPTPRSVEPFRAPTPPPMARQPLPRPTGPAPGHWVSGGPERVSFGAALRNFDPSGDLSWVFVGTTVSAFGALLLAILAPIATLPLVWMAVVLTIGGAALTLGILWTGARGRRKARAPLALFVSIPVAVLGATGLVVLKIAGQTAFEQFVEPPEEEASADPFFDAAADAVDEAVAPPTPAPIDKPAPEPVAAPPPAPKPPPAKRRPKPKPRPRPVAPKPPPRTPSRPVLVPPVKPSPAPPPLATRASGDLPKSVSGEAVRLMLTDYAKAKACFVPLANRGILPSRVDTRFKIMPDGNAQDFLVIAPDVHTNGELERCLRRAVTALQFPQSQMGAQVEYPFVLQ